MFSNFQLRKLSDICCLSGAMVFLNLLTWPPQSLMSCTSWGLGGEDLPDT